ncbi:MAG: MFS transporter [Acidobacteria bacterium]|nr:MFS transporter [Acidobacteriota bacterium]
MASATYKELLTHNREFRNLWTGQVISELGTWFSFIAELGMVRMFSGSPFAATALMAGRMLPFLLVAPFAGVFADRLSRKRIMLSTDLLRAVLALIYLFALATRSVWIVVVGSFVMASLSMFFDAAKNAAIPNLVTPRELLTANVMMLSTRFLQYTLGAALGGLTAAQFGYPTAFIVNSLSFVASALCIAVIPAVKMKKAVADNGEVQAASETALASGASSGEVAEAIFEKENLAAMTLSASSGEKVAALRAPSATNAGTKALSSSTQETTAALPAAAQAVTAAVQRPRFFTDVREGLAYIWATPFVRAVILLNIFWATGGGMPNLLFDQIGGHDFAHGDRGDWSVAALFTASGAGVFFGMMLARRVGDWMSEERRAAHFIGWSLLMQGVLFAFAGWMPTLLTMCLLVTASRFLLGVEFGVQETMVMRVLPDEYRGRVFSTDRSLEFGMMTLSMIAASWLLHWYSPREMIVVSGLLSASPGLLWLLAIFFTKFRVPTHAVRTSFGD